MSRLSKSLLGIFASILFVGIASAGLSLVVDYKPYGVPDARRAEYEDKVAAIAIASQKREAAAKGPSPSATTAYTRHLFGMLDPHTSASHDFPVTNDGEAPLILEVNDTTCKCTVGKLGQRVLQPSESTNVTMTWNTGYQADHYEQSAQIVTNDPNRPAINLTVEGTIRAQLVAPRIVSVGKANPGAVNRGSFVFYSQLWNECVVDDVQSEDGNLVWEIEPVDVTTEPSLSDAEASVAWRVNVTCVSPDSGKFALPAKLIVRSTENGDVVERDIEFRGRVHQSISFHGPLLDSRTGLDVGTLVNDRDHTFRLLVRQRAGLEKDLEVLKTEPSGLKVTMKPVGRRGDYQLTVVVPKGCKPVLFNLDSKQGFIEVGNAETPGLSNWFPVQGAVVEIAK